MRFRDRGVVVTGATSGIGAATARAFAAEGASVVVTGQNEARAEAVVAAIRTAGGRADYLLADLADAAGCANLIPEAIRRLGRLDVLVNNAGILRRAGTLESTLDQWAESMAVNVTAPFILGQAAGRHMKEQGGGAIVNVSSELGLYADAGTVSYCASKGALVQLSRAMALDLAPYGVRVNCLCPGRTLTPLLEGAMAQWGIPREEGLARRRQWMPIRRIAEPEEIARAILFLASDDASFVVGATLSADGGTSIAGPGGAASDRGAQTAEATAAQAAQATGQSAKAAGGRG